LSKKSAHQYANLFERDSKFFFFFFFFFSSSSSSSSFSFTDYALWPVAIQN
jgi:hypothetical protein